MNTCAHRNKFGTVDFLRNFDFILNNREQVSKVTKDYRSIFVITLQYEYRNWSFLLCSNILTTWHKASLQNLDV